MSWKMGRVQLVANRPQCQVYLSAVVSSLYIHVCGKVVNLNTAAQ